MTSRLQPYMAYEPINYDYVNQLPNGWKLLPNIAIFEERIQRGHDSEELLSVTIGKGIIKQTDVEIKKDSSNEDKSKYKLVKEGDIAYNKMRMWQGALGYSHFTGIVSPAYIVLKPKMKINPRYFHYMFRSGQYTNYSKRFSYGIVDDQLSLRYTDFKRMYSIVPPLVTQNAIVTYLDRKNGKIDSFVKRKEKLIEILENEKDRIISKAISNGIDNDVEMKSLEEDWLKEIPINWEFKPLKYYVYLNLAALKEKTNPNYEIQYVDIGNVTFKGLVNVPEKLLFKDAPSRARRIVRTGDTILSTVRTYLKAIAYFENCDDNIVASTGFAVLTPKRTVIPKYLKYLLSSSYFINKVNFWAVGVNYPAINNDRLLAIKVPLPNDIGEQGKIVNYIENEISKLNSAIDKATSEIFAIKEYQESLITEIVTGKRNVTDTINTSFSDDAFDVAADGVIGYNKSEHHNLS